MADMADAGHDFAAAGLFDRPAAADLRALPSIVGDIVRAAAPQNSTCGWRRKYGQRGIGSRADRMTP